MSDPAALLAPVPLAALLAPTRHRADAQAGRLAAARAEAFAAGVAAGEAAAAERIAGLEQQLAAGEAEAAARLADADARATAAAGEIVGALAGALATLGLAVARAVLAVEPSTPAERVAAQLARLLAALPEGAAGRLFHAPGAPVPAAALPPGWTLAEDPMLEADALRAEVEASALSVSLTQLLHSALLRLETAG